MYYIEARVIIPPGSTLVVSCKYSLMHTQNLLKLGHARLQDPGGSVASECARGFSWKKDIHTLQKFDGTELHCNEFRDFACDAVLVHLFRGVVLLGRRLQHTHTLRYGAMQAPDKISPDTLSSKTNTTVHLKMSASSKQLPTPKLLIYEEAASEGGSPFCQKTRSMYQGQSS